MRRQAPGSSFSTAVVGLAAKMKLIAETKEEDRILDILPALLSGLGVPVTGLHTNEAYALTCWSADTLLSACEAEQALTSEAASHLLMEMENDLRSAMALAGARVLCGALAARENTRSRR